MNKFWLIDWLIDYSTPPTLSLQAVMLHMGYKHDHIYFELNKVL